MSATTLTDQEAIVFRSLAESLDGALTGTLCSGIAFACGGCLDNVTVCESHMLYWRNVSSYRGASKSIQFNEHCVYTFLQCTECGGNVMLHAERINLPQPG